MELLWRGTAGECRARSYRATIQKTLPTPDHGNCERKRQAEALTYKHAEN